MNSGSGQIKEENSSITSSLTQDLSPSKTKSKDDVLKQTPPENDASVEKKGTKKIGTHQHNSECGSEKASYKINQVVMKTPDMRSPQGKKRLLKEIKSSIEKKQRQSPMKLSPTKNLSLDKQIQLHDLKEELMNRKVKEASVKELFFNSKAHHFY